MVDPRLEVTGGAVVLVAAAAEWESRTGVEGQAQGAFQISSGAALFLIKEWKFSYPQSPCACGMKVGPNSFKCIYYDIKNMTEESVKRADTLPSGSYSFGHIWKEGPDCRVIWLSGCFPLPS